MHDQTNPGGGMTPADEDDQLQVAVLSHLLDLYPALITVGELGSTLLGAAEPELGDIERAIRDLAGAGLLHRHGAFVFASHAAVRFDALPF